MSQNQTPNDQELITDFVLGRIDDPAARKQIEDRLAKEPKLRQLHNDIRNTFGALDLSAEIEPPDDLVSRTMARIRTAKQTEALLAREQLARRDVIRPTFSMRELSAVAGIVLVIGTVFMLSFQEAGRRRLQSDCQRHAQKIGAALLSYAGHNNSMLPSVAAPNGRWLPTEDQPAVSNSKALFELVKQKYAEPPTFQCPAVDGESFALQPCMTDFPGSQYIGYSYQHSIGEAMSTEALQPVRKNMAILADSSPVFNDGRFRADCLNLPSGDNHGHTGQTVLYLDGHTDFQTQPSVGVGGDNIYLAGGIRDYKGDEKPSGPTDTFVLPAYTPAKCPGAGGR